MTIQKHAAWFFALFMTLNSQVMALVDIPQDWVDTGDTVVAFVANDGTPVMHDIGGVYTPSITGGTFGYDTEVGGFVQFAASGTTGLSFNYTGATDVLRGSGFTLEAWIKPEPGSLTSANLVTKVGAFAIGFSNAKMGLLWMNLPTSPIYVEPGSQQYNYYPMAFGVTGTSPLVMSAWNHVVLTYDENLKVARTWVNGVLDRDCDVLRDDQQWVNLPNGAFTMFSNLHNAGIAGIRLRAGVHNPADAPAMKAYLTQLPWEGRMVLNIDKIAPSLELPITISADLPGIGVYSTTLSSWRESTSIEIPYPNGSAAIREVNITATANGTGVFSKAVSYVNNLPATPAPTDSVTVNPDKSISKNGIKIFPRFLYHAQSADLATIKGMGFNLALGKDPNGVFMGLPARNINDSLAFASASESNGLFVSVRPSYTDSNFNTYMSSYKSLSSLLFWYCWDEPWQAWDSVRANYNNIRLLDPNHPSVTMINNSIHLKEGATTCDILGCDPYPIPNVSLRLVSDLTSSAIKGSYGLKPVWAVLDAYNGKMPTLEELRCMSYLALCAGANGIGIYAWDDRLKSGGVWTGYYMPADYPDAVPIVTEVMQDLESLESILVEPNIPEAVAINPEQPALHAAIKVADERAYLFVANDSRQAESGVITLAPGHTVTANPLPQSGYLQPLQFTSGTCQITFPALGAGLFELQWPYRWAPTALPGRIEAENFDLGGEGVAYHDTTSGNYGATYRMTDVDVTTTGDVGGGYRVGWFGIGEWLEYTVNPEPGTYTVYLRISCPGANGTALLSLDGVPIGSVAIPNTGGQIIYQTVSLPNVSLQGGVQVLRITVAGRAFDLNWIDFVKNP